MLAQVLSPGILERESMHLGLFEISEFGEKTINLCFDLFLRKWNCSWECTKKQVLVWRKTLPADGQRTGNDPWAWCLPRGSTGRSVLSSWLAGDSVLLACGLSLQEVYDVCMVACPQKLKINRFYWYCHYCCFSWPFYWLLNLFGWKFTDEFKVSNLSEQCVVVCVFRGGMVEVGKVRLTSMTRLLFEKKK